MSATRLTLVLGAALLVTAPAWAQYQLGDGRLLDRNLQQGSGGVNQPTAPPASAYGQYGNAIVTGNVGGLGGFHGNVGYRAPGEFSGPTPVDTFNFRQQALSPYTGATGAYQPQYTNPQFNAGGGGNIIYRSGSGVTSGAVSGQPAYSSQYYMPSASIRRDEVVGGQLQNPYISTRESTLDATASRFTQQPLGYTTAADGTLYQVSASPLTGVRRDPLEVNRLITDPAQQVNQPPKPDSTSATPAIQTVPGATLPAAPPTEPQTSDDKQAAGFSLDRRLDDRLASEPLGERLGERISAVAGGDAMVRPGMFRADVLEKAILERQGSMAAQPGEDVYFDLLRRIRKQAPTSPGAVQDQMARADAPKTEVDRIAEQFARARAGEEAQRTRAEVDRLLGKLDYKLPPMPTLTAAGDSGFNRMMAAGESKIQSGEYFRAEEAYARALALRPDYPLAKIGRVHAQVGSGVYLSAGAMLRDVLAKNPELIASRYGEQVLPPTKTLQKADEDLEALMKVSRRPESALLAAYLAFQQNRPDVLRHALDELTKRSPNDPLVPVLRRLWQGNIDITRVKTELQPKIDPDALPKVTPPVNPNQPPEDDAAKKKLPRILPPLPDETPQAPAPQP